MAISTTPISTATFFRRTVLVVAVATAPVLIWYLFDVILITVGAIVLATLFRLAAEPSMRWLRLPEPLALAFSVLLLVVCAAGIGYLFGARLAGEVQVLIERVSAAQASVQTSLQGSSIGRMLMRHVGGGGVPISKIVSSVFAISTTLVEGVVVMVIAGVYFAAQPELYRAGMIELFPPRMHGRVSETLDAVGHALRLWLLGQLLQMLLIGILSAVACWLVGLPSPLALGLIAGAAEFIPYFGPIIAAVPAILVALAQGGSAALWTLVAYVLIHQTEGNLIVPLVQRHMIYIPPAVILIGIVAIGFLFGTVSMVFAAPMAVMIFVALKKAYIRDTLREETDIPGEAA